MHSDSAGRSSDQQTEDHFGKQDEGGQDRECSLLMSFCPKTSTTGIQELDVSFELTLLSFARHQTVFRAHIPGISGPSRVSLLWCNYKLQSRHRLRLFEHAAIN